MISNDLWRAFLLDGITGKLAISNDASWSVEEVDSFLKSINEDKGRCGISSEIKLCNEKVPMGWIGLKVKDIVVRDVSYGIIKLGSEDQDGVKVLRCSDVKDGYIDLANVRTVKKSLSDEYKRTILQGGEIVINVRGTLGGCAIVPPGLRGYNIAREVAVIDVPACINVEYLLLVLRSPYFWKYMLGNLRGIAYKGLNISLLNDFVIPFPSPNYQKHIVEIAKKVWEHVEAIRSMEDRLNEVENRFPDKFSSSILYEAFTGKLTLNHTDDNAIQVFRLLSEKKGLIIAPSDKKIPNCTLPQHWLLANLSDVADIYIGDSISESDKQNKYSSISDGIDYIATKDVGFDHVVAYNNGVKIPHSNDQFRRANKGDTLLCIEGGSAGRKIAIIDKEVCFGNKLCAFHTQVLDKKYLYYFLQSPLFLSVFKDKLSGIISGVNLNKIKKILIPIPPLEEQREMAEKLEKVLPLCRNLGPTLNS